MSLDTFGNGASAFDAAIESAESGDNAVHILAVSVSDDCAFSAVSQGSTATETTNVVAGHVTGDYNASVTPTCTVLSVKKTVYTD